MNETAITLAGNLVADPELRYTATGVPVTNFRVASTARFKDAEGWKDGDTLFLTVNAWRDLAEHVAESVTKGTKGTVTGRLRQRSYEREGQQVTVTEIEAADVGVSLQRATVKVAKSRRSAGEASNGQEEAPPSSPGQQPGRRRAGHPVLHPVRRAPRAVRPSGRPCRVILQ
jgi:single-strand DNA-binding protein